ncbi:histidine kinase [Bosea caraganae]|uniref:histidine kinase n=1 Tax=Bosea caraganae TaxID=2763117 RepID=A0A370LBJ0_9HYPH|nr:sensor histidine kinase [Bosea caraganae]RDJ27245.1 histidine kinase [Bosea caraganae]RDJ29261.1 histidine kinase [Bosea caraganae]
MSNPWAVSFVSTVFACAIVCGIIRPASSEHHQTKAILVLEESDVKGAFYAAIFSGLRSAISDNRDRPITIYSENLNLIRFSDREYEQSLRVHLAVKYKDKPIDAIVTVGSSALEYALRWRPLLWPDTPIVFAMADRQTVARLKLPPDVTGRTVRFSLQDMLVAARAVVPGLRRVALVGDPLARQPVFRHLEDELPAVAGQVDIIDLTGLPLRELRRRVADLPDATAILYTSLYSDGEGHYFAPADALERVAEVANRPIIIGRETFLEHGGIGGYLAIPRAIGEEAAQLALRILQGESPANLPIIEGNTTRPIFDWRLMQRWGVAAASLPDGSEVRFRPPTAWEQYSWWILAIAAALLLQGLMIVGLVIEHRRRRNAEIEARERLSEAALMSRRITIGDLSTSIAHELKQPLSAILSNAEAAQLIINSDTPDISEIKDILFDIKRDDQRAAAIISNIRNLLRKPTEEDQEIDLNKILSGVFQLISDKIASQNIDVFEDFSHDIPNIIGNEVQIQQVILNLVVNAVESIADSGGAHREIVGKTSLMNNDFVEIAILNSGYSIPSESIDQVFEPYHTTKSQGMGLGLSISRKIITAHRGRIWAENRTDGGVQFRINLPVPRAVQSECHADHRAPCR